MLQIAPGWTMDVDRGPDWLFLRVHSPSDDLLIDGPPLAEAVWNLVEQHRVYRVVLELDEVPRLHSRLIGQLLLVAKRILTHGGLLRVCGLSKENQEVLHATRLEEALPHYASRGEAIMGSRPSQPR